MGRIQAFGSIFVNDREIDTSKAVVSIDGRPGTESDLRLGQVVIARGIQEDEASPDGITRTGAAVEIIVNDLIDGPITASDPDSGHITVLGQPVILDETTIIDMLAGAESVEDLNIGDEVEVHGFPMADGSVRATRIADRAAGSEFEATGEASAVTPTSLALNELSVSYTAAALGGATLKNGDRVEVKGSTFGVARQLIATRIEVLDELHGEPGDAGEVEGSISRFNSFADFMIGRVRVATNESTAYAGGGPANLDVDTELVIRGDFDQRGTLVADSVTVRGAIVKLHGQVYTADANSLTILSHLVASNEDTVFDDASQADLDSLSFANIYAGDRLEVRSVNNPGSVASLVAQRIRRVDSLEETTIQGFVTSLGDPVFELQGIQVDTNQETDYRNIRGETITAAEFFALMTEGSIVKASGTQISHGSIAATEVNFEID